MTPFHTTRRVEFCDTDMAGIVHFANFFRYMEAAEHELFRSLDLKIAGQFPDGLEYGWPRVSATCSYKSPARYEEVLEIYVTIVRRTDRSLSTSYEFTREGQTLAVGEMKTVFCIFPKGAAMQSAVMPDEIAAKLDGAAGI
ncbi:MAG: 4-hydroxybenzoyl-CoA thioesterase [Planctomycetales bacterium 12-60-4]|nr:MAG: 4-hydroxybenzoyl-CoA thioesterase [Planctomycetales bacterium 12-60-4]